MKFSDIAVILIATRSDSKRFPNKVFKPINGLPAIEHLLKRLSKSKIPVYLCVPHSCYEYEHLRDKYKVDIYNGNPDSPLHRMADCVREYNLNQPYIIRITHDDILIDVETMETLLKECMKRKDVGYGITPQIVEGAGVEIIHRDNLLFAADNRREPTEFVSYFVKKYPKEINIKLTPRSSVIRNYRLTMDYYEDYVLLESVLRSVGNNASVDKILDYLDKNPHLLNINKLPLVSVYTCAYNAEKYIDRTITSLLSHNQHIDFEYIFVDDGSTDHTLQKVLRYAYDKRIKILVNERNMGLASSSNVALNNCRGSYVMRLDADDLIMTGTLSTLYDKLTLDHAGIVYPGYVLMDKNEHTTSKAIDPRLHHHAGCALMDKRMINEIRFTDGLKHYDSWDLFTRINGKVKISYLEEPLWYYRKHPKSLSSKNTSARRKTLKAIKEKTGYAR